MNQTYGIDLFGISATDFATTLTNSLQTVGPILGAILVAVVGIAVVRFVFNFIRSRLSR